jgi:hypothetical protein
MLSLVRSRTTLIWSLLIGATAASWAMGHGMGIRAIRDAGVAIIVVAFIKVRFVILEFMEVRHAPLPMRIVGEAWVLLICAVLILLYLKGEANV